MCLYKPSKRKVAKRTGYKIFFRDGSGHIMARFMGTGWYKENEWEDSIRHSDFCVNNISTMEPNLPFGSSAYACYPSGFHIYLTKEAAKLESITRGEFVRKVRFSKPVAVGWQHGRIVVVAKRIKILPGDVDVK